MKRFSKNLNKKYGKQLITFAFNGKKFEVRATRHALERFTERNIDVNISLGDIISLGKARLYSLAKNGEDVAIINSDKAITTIITFEGNYQETQIRIRTIIKNHRVYIKKGTKIYRLNQN